MRIHITGICGFVGSSLAKFFLNLGHEVSGIDNFVRNGSETNRRLLIKKGCNVIHGDIRLLSDVLSIPKCDWIIDAAANPSVLAGSDNNSSSYQLLENNLIGTINLLEYAKKNQTGLIILSTSRVYSIKELCNINVIEKSSSFHLDEFQQNKSVSLKGIDEKFSTETPISLYGSTKLTSEILAQEYSNLYSFPLWINRCGVLAGSGQFGKLDQGIFSYWINSWLNKKDLSYIGFKGTGFQVRDVLHPNDLASLIIKQFNYGLSEKILFNVSGGIENSISLKNLSNWCLENIGKHNVKSITENRKFDVPHLVLDSTNAIDMFSWKPEIQMEQIFSEVLNHAIDNPNWLEISN
jgi:CDP-paratose 2-epimerase